MNKHELIRSNDSWVTDTLPEPLNLLPKVSADVAYRCKRSVETGEGALLNGYIGKAIVEMTKGPNSSICVIKVGAGLYSGEYTLDSGERVVCCANSKGELKASIIPTSGKRWKEMPEIGNPAANCDTTGILALYLQMLIDSDEDAGLEAKEYWDALVDELNRTGKYNEELFYKLNGCLQWALVEGKVKATVKNGAIDLLTKQKINTNSLVGEIVCGQSVIICPNATPVTAKGVTLQEAKKMFEAYAQSRTWSAEEELRIRSFPDDVIVPDEIIRMAHYFVTFRGTRMPANNFCWRGITGCGKSTGTALLSAILHTPLYIMTCSTNMETDDFLSRLVPVTENDAVGEMPCVEDILYDPAYAYELVTGEKKESATAQMALDAVMAACASRGAGTTGFKRVESEYVKALRSGAIVEIQEFSRIRDSGVLVGLNEYDHAGALIPLVDGSYAVRHEDAICVYTDNVGYASCRPVDPSVTRRMAAVFDTFSLEKKSVVDRAIYNTGCTDRASVEGMFDIWNDIREFCAKEDITEGELSPSDLERWVSFVMADGMACIRTAMSICLISKLSTDAETQEQINGVAMASLDAHFPTI